MDDAGGTDEAFLSVQAGSKSARRLSSDNPALLDALQDLSKPSDIYFTKSHYSAFKSGSLVQTLRRNLITELFICGALSNTSVYATAVEAASYGIRITLVDDCLGWRGKSRHEHAMDKLKNEYGYNRLSSAEIIADIQDKNAQTTAERPVRHQENEELATMLDMLKLQGGTSRRPNSDANDIQGELKASSPGPPMATTHLGEDVESLAALPRPIASAGMVHKARVSSEIMQRRDLEKKIETPVKNESEPSRKEAPARTSANEETSEELPPKDQTLRKRAPSSEAKCGRTASTTGKSDRPSAMSVKSNTLPRDNAPQQSLLAPVRQTNISPNSTTRSVANMACPAEGEPICEGDTVVITNLLPPDVVCDIFEKLKAEVQWQKMSHQGGEVPRLVAVQGEVGKGGEIPVYRHPADEAPPLLAFSPAVSLIRRHVERASGHAVNHCLIQYYRDGKDYISEHSDKTLDIIPNTYIANVSLGAERTMVLRRKRDSNNSDSGSPRKTARADLPHNSMMRMGLATNMRWMHAIRQDKRREQEKTAAELDFGGCRISLTFRLIGTFLSKDQSKIWGQGAVAKDKAQSRNVVNGTTDEGTRMIQAFSLENRTSEFDWQVVYGYGFDVLHMSNTRKLLLSEKKLIDDGVRAVLEHLGLEWIPSSITTPVNAESEIGEPLVKLIDTDISRSTVQGHAAVLLYLDAVHWKRDIARTPFEFAKLYTRLYLATSLAATDITVKALDAWETFAAEDVYIAGPELSTVDFAFFPILHSFREFLENGDLLRLEVYYRTMEEVDAIRRVLSISDSG